LAREVGRANAEACDSSIATMAVRGTAREAVAPAGDLPLAPGNCSETLADMSVGAMTSAITNCSLRFPAGVYRLGSLAEMASMTIVATIAAAKYLIGMTDILLMQSSVGTYSLLSFCFA
jgi:hypothetical protein